MMSYITHVRSAWYIWLFLICMYILQVSTQQQYFGENIWDRVKIYVYILYSMDKDTLLYLISW
jgi:hypothetical protein